MPRLAGKSDTRLCAYSTPAPAVRHVAEEKSGRRYRGKAVGFPSDYLARGAEAVFEARSNDTVVIARKVLEAALRNTDDFETLLQSQQQTQPRRPKPVVRASKCRAAASYRIAERSCRNCGTCSRPAPVKRSL